MNIIEEGRRTFDIEIEALKKTRDQLDCIFSEIVNKVINCNGKVIITGMGKPGHIGTKLAATFSSLGTPSFFLHPAEAEHGDLGMIDDKDIVIAISYSGESDEIVKILPNIKMIGATLIAITGNANSTLARESDIVQVLPKFKEACYLGLAPTSSTTAVLCYGDALAVVASAIYGFKDTDFGKYHPAGALGKKLIYKVDDLMAKDAKNPIVNINSTLKEAIISLSKHGLGMVSVIDDSGDLSGIITDGDLRRMLEKGIDVYNMAVKDVMTINPITIVSGALAFRALGIMKENNISCLPVIDGKRVVGAIRIHDIINAGIVAK